MQPSLVCAQCGASLRSPAPPHVRTTLCSPSPGGLPPPCPPLLSLAIPFAVGLSPDGVMLYFFVIFAVGRSPDGDKQMTNYAKSSSSVGLRWLALQRGLTGRWTTGLGSVDTSTSV